VTEAQDPRPVASISGKTAAVTGASGFIGGRLVERLIEQSVAVTCLLRGKPGVGLQATGAGFVTLDIADREALQRALHGVDHVFHLAYDWEDADWNFRALRALISVCGEGHRRLVHTSSFVAYDIPPAGELTEETIGTTATCGYAHVKRALDEELIKAVRQGAVEAAIVQPTIVYGPRSAPWTVEPSEMLRHGTVVLPDRGEGVCNAVYVDDVVTGMILAATEPAAIGQRFLISGEPVTWAQFYEAMAQAAGAKGPVYLPAEMIVDENRRLRKLQRIATSPRRMLRILAQRRLTGKLIRGGLRLLPASLGAGARDRLYGPPSRQRKHIHMPDRGRLEFLQGRSTIRSGKAKRLLGYVPQFDLAAGMIPTARFLAATTAGRSSWMKRPSS